MNLWELAEIIRQNHALEHATLHVLARRHPGLALMGRSTHSGFVIYGPLNSDEIAGAAAEAIARLQEGEVHLAVHPRCGTNLAVTSLVAGAAAYGASLGRSRSRLERLPMALLAATVGAIASQPLALKVQRRVTTSPQVARVRVLRVTRSSRTKIVAHKVDLGRE